MSQILRNRQRPRRLRRSSSIRSLVEETTLASKDLVLPVFVKEGQKINEPIPSLPGHSRLSLDQLYPICDQCLELGIPALALFPVVDEKLKDKQASESARDEGLIPRALRDLKSRYPDLTLIGDVAMDPYSSDGHDGLVKDGQILNDPTLIILAEQALAQARAGVDFVAPSDMMDGRVGFIRDRLDAEGFTHVGIISYAAKYASGFYGPFREALDSAPKFGDKKTYQMNPANATEALREAALDVREGADILMVKPALNYLDIIYRLKTKFHLPIAAYHVSGEYSMIMTAAQNGWLNGDQCLMESLLCIRRAGADMIFTYGAVRAAELLRAQ